MSSKCDTPSSSLGCSSKAADARTPTHEEVYDTVGAVVVDAYGTVAAGVSSGGIAMKMDGRIGDSAVFGCGVWAENPQAGGRAGVATTTTGVGENIVRMLLAKSCSEKVQNMGDDTTLDQVRRGLPGFCAPAACVPTDCLLFFAPLAQRFDRK